MILTSPILISLLSKNKYQMRKAHNIVFLLYFLFCLSSCIQSSNEKEYKIGFSQCCIDEWRESMEADIRREISFHDNTELIISNAGNDSKQQIEDIRKLVSSDIDVLIVSPNEGVPLTHIIDSIYDRGVPVIHFYI